MGLSLPCVCALNLTYADNNFECKLTCSLLTAVRLRWASENSMLSHAESPIKALFFETSRSPLPRNVSSR